jgi:ABC-type phosphate transport system substrate-binding protein
MVFKGSYFLACLLFIVSASYSGRSQITNLEGLIIIGNQIGTSQLTKSKTNEIFRGRNTVWSNGNTVVLVLPSQRNDNSALVARLLYQTTVKGMQKYWLSLVFQGRGNPPVFLDSDKEIVEYVLKTPGAIGLVKQEYSVDKKIEIQIK